MDDSGAESQGEDAIDDLVVVIQEVLPVLGAIGERLHAVNVRQKSDTGQRLSPNLAAVQLLAAACAILDAKLPEATKYTAQALVFLSDCHIILAKPEEEVV